MLRSVKYGLCGALVAGAVASAAAWTTVDSPAGKTVRLVVDGQARTIQTTVADVGHVVTAAGFHPGAHDLLAPAAGSPLRDGATIVLNRGRLLRLDIDGADREVWTTAPTVAIALSQLGFSTTDFTSVSRSRRLPLGATDISVRTPKLITIVHDGRRTRVTTTAATVGRLMTELSLRMGPYDRLSVPRPSLPRAGAKITLTRVVHKKVHTMRPIAFGTSSTKDSALATGTTQIVTAGRTGVLKTTWAAVYVDGKLVGKTKISSTVLRKPITKVQRVGTLQPTVVQQPAASSSPPTAGSRSAAPQSAPTGSPKDIAKSMLGNYGWGQDQFGCLDEMWIRESGWRVNAANPSGAYGIPQALPGSKMASAGPDWQTSAATQIKWGLGYIASRYNSPCQAWSTWQSQGWY